jgi:hypothetical protein
MYIKKMFHIEQMFSLPYEDLASPLNREAHQMYLNDFSGFIQQAKSSVDKSISQQYNNPPSSMIKLTQHVPAHDRIIDKIKEVGDVAEID